MTASRARIAAAALMAGGLVLAAAPMSAAAHTGNLFTWAYLDEGDDNRAGFATVSTSNAAVSLLPTLYDGSFSGTGADICGEDAWAVSDSEDGGVVFSWNHDTGEIGEFVTLTGDPADFEDSSVVDVIDVWAADSLPDCTALALVYYHVVIVGGGDFDTTVLASIDRATGLTRVIADLPETQNENEINWEGVATDPTTGTTYVFAEYLGYPRYATVDRNTGTLGSLSPMEGLSTYFESDGFPLEADFQPDGVLWYGFGVNELEQFRLIAFAAGADLGSENFTDRGPIEAVEPQFFDGGNMLTYDAAAAPVLPATGGAPTGMLLVGGVLFLAGLVLLAVRRLRLTSSREGSS